MISDRFELVIVKQVCVRDKTSGRTFGPGTLLDDGRDASEVAKRLLFEDGGINKDGVNILEEISQEI